MSTIIHIVATNFKDQHGTTAWFWDRDEARNVYVRRIEEVGDTHAVSLYRLDINDAVDEIVAEAISNEVIEVIDSHEPSNADEEARGVLESMLSNALTAQDLDRARLQKYREDQAADVQEDTAAMIERTERKISNGETRINALRYAISKF